MSNLIEPRYEYYKGTTGVIDNELDTFVEDVVDRLNEQDFNKKELLKVKQNQDEQIADLQHRLEVADKALELSCDYLNAVEGDELYELCKDIYNDNDYLIVKMNYFKEQAEREVKGE